jgi:hypothetical protein
MLNKNRVCFIFSYFKLSKYYIFNNFISKFLQQKTNLLTH